MNGLTENVQVRVGVVFNSCSGSITCNRYDCKTLNGDEIVSCNRFSHSLSLCLQTLQTYRTVLTHAPFSFSVSPLFSSPWPSSSSCLWRCGTGGRVCVAYRTSASLFSLPCFVLAVQRHRWEKGTLTVLFGPPPEPPKAAASHSAAISPNTYILKGGKSVGKIIGSAFLKTTSNNNTAALSIKLRRREKSEERGIAD